MTEAMSQGAFRMGARAMRDAIESRLSFIGTMAQARAAETPIPEFPALPVTSSAEWNWWAGTNDEWYQVGPCGTRENAVEMFHHDYGRETRCYLIEATRRPVAFSAEDMISAQYFEDNEDFDYEHNEPDRTGGADVISAADSELQALLDAWASRWQHTFITPNMFGAMRNHEVVPGECLDCGQDCGEACPADPANAGRGP